MIKKAKVKMVRKPVVTKEKLLATIKEQEELLRQGQNLMNAMQAEIKQLTAMHRTQLQIIDNLSTKIRDEC